MKDLLDILKGERDGYTDLIETVPATTGELKQFDRGVLTGMDHTIELVRGYYDKNTQ